MRTTPSDEIKRQTLFAPPQVNPSLNRSTPETRPADHVADFIVVSYLGHRLCRTDPLSGPTRHNGST